MVVFYLIKFFLGFTEKLNGYLYDNIISVYRHLFFFFVNTKDSYYLVRENRVFFY